MNLKKNLGTVLKFHPNVRAGKDKNLQKIMRIQG
jgi:hypothetical protein